MDGCTDEHKGHGFCNRHYQRWVKYGTPEPPRPSFEDRFWSKVNKTDTCWLWTAGTSAFGYGTIQGPGGRKGSRLGAHRVSLEMHTGQPIPAGMFVCHTCDVPACVRPDHLFIASQKVNIEDMMAKGRAHMSNPLNGERNPAARLSAADVRIIKQRLRAGERSAVIAEDYPVGRNTIDWIKKGRIWKQVA